MKSKISVSLNEETIMKIMEKLREDRFRNKSHIVEEAIKKYLD